MAAAATADPLKSIAKIERFVYIGNLLPVYTRKREYVPPASFNQIDSLLQPIDGENFRKLMEKWLEQKSLPRKDELWFTFASYLMGGTKIGEKLKVRDRFPSIATTPDDLFLFARYAMSIQKHQGKKGLTKTIRKAIVLWYKAKTSAQMMEFLGCNRGLHGLRHKDLIVLCHINLSKFKLENTALPLFKRHSKCIQYCENPANAEMLDDSMKKMHAIAQLKICENIENAKSLIEENELKYEHVPQNLLSKPEIWELILPRMNYEQILQSCGFVVDNKMFMNASFGKAFLAAIGRKECIKKFQIHPFVFLSERNKQLKEARYSEKIKACYYSKKIEKYNIKPFKPINDVLEKNFEQSFKLLQGSGLRVFITINLQEGYAKRPVISQKQVTCFEAAITLAFSFFKSERFAVAYTFSPETDKLTQIQWNKEFTYKKAEELCRTLMNKKNYQRNYLPLKEASTKKYAYDLFLTIVPSATRGNAKNKPDKLLEQLSEYKEKHNKRAKMVIVNLCRYKSAMFHSAEQKDGILEICGLDENTPKLISAFGAGNFS